MSNPNLVPTPTTDVNGKQTTVHKRPAGAVKATERVKKIGAPASSASVTPEVPVFTVDNFISTLRSVGYGSQQDWDVSEKATADFKAVRQNFYENHYDSIWEGQNLNVLGGRDGWSEQDIRTRLDGVISIIERVESGELKSDEFFEGENDYTKYEVLAWCSSLETALNDALETKGRSLAVNGKAVVQRRGDFEGGGNRS
jgi:hypothetical protein